ncbi:DUF305 domain-containing protein [Nesterenkonia populi]|uniref:DUF305 domain-containing protein n=1 Tax=Nesterenkonia populi TaxID=1591087 RepID=UPI0011BE1BD2|nr:DUF305 domain-containing protein [Nesterenkonia populi]
MRTTFTPQLAGLLAASLVLSSCAQDGDQGSSPAGEHDQHTPEATDAQFNEADVEYVSGMIVHHQQAVEMSDLLLEEDDADPDAAALAEDIRAAQQPEIDEMETWLAAWGHETSDEDEHREHGASHEGMMSEGDLEQLETASGEEASRLFLEQMIIHHEGAVSMAEDHLENGESPDALELSENVISEQSAEISQMQEMLEDLS